MVSDGYVTGARVSGARSGDYKALNYPAFLIKSGYLEVSAKIRASEERCSSRKVSEARTEWHGTVSPYQRRSPTDLSGEPYPKSTVVQQWFSKFTFGVNHERVEICQD